MKEYIERGALINRLERFPTTINRDYLLAMIDGFPAADVVSAEAYKQIMWERDMQSHSSQNTALGLERKRKTLSRS